MSCDYLLLSNGIFTGLEDIPFSGYVAITGNKITDIGQNVEYAKSLVEEQTKVIDFKDSTLCAGFMDNHTFFMGNMLKTLGIDLYGLDSFDTIIENVKLEAGMNVPVYGCGWDSGEWYDAKDNSWIKKMDRIFGKALVVLLDAERGNALMTSEAISYFGFSPEEVYPEAMHKLFRELVKNKSLMKAEFKKFMTFLNKRGITSVKDIAFDDYLGMYPILNEMKNDKELTIRVNFASQIVAAPASVKFAEECKWNEDGYFLNFMGFKYMTDGDFDTFDGDLLEPYSNNPDVTVAEPVNYQNIENEVMKLDRAGYRVSIHAEGDRAVRECVNIFEKCANENGRRDARHSIIDLELSHPDDYARMQDLDVQAEIYGQLLLLNDSPDFMLEHFGEERAKYYLNYGEMTDAGVKISIGTDMPLLNASIPESIIALTGRRFCNNQPKEGWHPETAMKLADVLRAWTKNSAYFAFKEEVLGTLEVGKLADVSVLNANVFQQEMDEMQEIEAIFTMVDGKVVYQA